jgi:periplasmic copper chaperone A
VKPAPTLAMMALMALAACNQPAKQPAAAASQGAAPVAASKGPASKPGLTLQGGRLVLPAVKGNPGAAYFMIDNASAHPVTLAAVSIAGADKAQMHQSEGDTMTEVDSAEIIPGTSLTFEPGKLHVMVFGIGDKLKPGTTAEMTLTFDDGDKLSTPLKVEAAGAGSGEMGSMGAMH